jgi:GNAT superfamily N-acetyltransferase
MITSGAESVTTECAGVESLRIEATPYQDPVGAMLRAELMVDLSRRYGGLENGDETPVTAAEFEAPNGGLLVAWAADQPLGCVGWRAHGDSVAELKRMWVRPQARGRGIARALLAAIETAAREAGRDRMILETGTAQPEAIALYESAGYQRIADFGHYAGESEVRSYGRDL